MSERDLEPSEQKGPEGERIDVDDEGTASEGARPPERNGADRPEAEADEAGSEDERGFTQRNVGGKGELEP